MYLRAFNCTTEELLSNGAGSSSELKLQPINESRLIEIFRTLNDDDKRAILGFTKDVANIAKFRRNV